MQKKNYYKCMICFDVKRISIKCMCSKITRDLILLKTNSYLKNNKMEVT